MPDCSPAKWHRAHTTWFFETFVLAPRGVPVFDSTWGFLFNSYYETLGPRQIRAQRGLLSRPTAAQIGDYRNVIDEHMTQLLSRADEASLRELAPLLELGMAHEEQHQELILTDILHAFSTHPFHPAYLRSRAQGGASARAHDRASTTKQAFCPYPGGLFEIGAPQASQDGASFRFDNEEPRHHVWVEPYELATRLVTVGEWKAFKAEGGYERASLWLSEGADWLRAHDIHAPLYLHEDKHGALCRFGLDGLCEVSDDEPLMHVSYYEADAIAHFLGARLPTEAEWELAARDVHVAGNFAESNALVALPAPASHVQDGPQQLFGDVWEWTSSSYSPYPGYTPRPGALGEYNGKFMVNQMVLRGGSCLTPRAHMRATYRNFWPPHTRFQMSGIRLARSLPKTDPLPRSARQKP